MEEALGIFAALTMGQISDYLRTAWKSTHFQLAIPSRRFVQGSFKKASVIITTDNALVPNRCQNISCDDTDLLSGNYRGGVGGGRAFELRH